MTNSRNDSSKVAAAKGPLPAKTPQAAKPERMSAVVAVSRGPHRSAAHNSGRTARNPSALLNAVCSISGLKAMTPTTTARRQVRLADANTLLQIERSEIAERPEHDDRRNDEHAGRVAQPPRASTRQ